ncbi:MAG: hypothetical protein WCV84_04185 [Patescibacteria group bacterium]
MNQTTDNAIETRTALRNMAIGIAIAFTLGGGAALLSLLLR